MFFTPPETLTIESTLAELPAIDSIVDLQTTGEEVLNLFKNNPANPGVIVFDKGTIHGLISREGFFEATGRRFGVEIFLGRPISAMLEHFSTQPLILSEQITISRAIFEALNRSSRSVYDPIIVKSIKNTYQVLDILTVFLAENKILLTLHKQNIFTIASGIKLTDEEAVKRFVRFTGIIRLENPRILITRQNIKCDTCGEKIEYSIPDVVRSHPQINKGVEVSERMGNKTFVLYVRHRCGNDIREIPVFLDNDLNIRALRPSRLVETYVND